jgi:hypothetical protein
LRGNLKGFAVVIKKLQNSFSNRKDATKKTAQKA